MWGYNLYLLKLGTIRVINAPGTGENSTESSFVRRIELQSGKECSTIDMSKTAMACASLENVLFNLKYEGGLNII